MFVHQLDREIWTQMWRAHFLLGHPVLFIDSGEQEQGGEHGEQEHEHGEQEQDGEHGEQGHEHGEQEQDGEHREQDTRTWRTGARTWRTGAGRRTWRTGARTWRTGAGRRTWRTGYTNIANRGTNMENKSRSRVRHYGSMDRKSVADGGTEAH